MILNKTIFTYFLIGTTFLVTPSKINASDSGLDGVEIEAEIDDIGVVTTPTALPDIIEISIEDPIESEIKRKSTRFDNIPGTLEDDQARCAGDFWAIMGNVFEGGTFFSGCAAIICTSISQGSWASDSKVFIAFGTVGTVFTWTTAFLKGLEISARKISQKRKQQAMGLANEYNKVKGLIHDKDADSQV